MILALQFHPGDAEVACELVNLICDLEPQGRSDVEFALSHRRDVNSAVVEIMRQRLLERFSTVHVWEGKRFETGWPNGSNALWHETMVNAQLSAKTGKSAAQCVFTFEPDCVPVDRDWINKLKPEWERCQAAGKVFIGYEDSVHINGNCIVDINILEKHPKLSSGGAGGGWDWYNRTFIKEHIGLGTPLIHQFYERDPKGQVKLSLDEVIAKGAILYHGLKGTKLIQEVWQKLCNFD